MDFTQFLEMIPTQQPGGKLTRRFVKSDNPAHAEYFRIAYAESDRMPSRLSEAFLDSLHAILQKYPFKSIVDSQDEKIRIVTFIITDNGCNTSQIQEHQTELLALLHDFGIVTFEEPLEYVIEDEGHHCQRNN